MISLSARDDNAVVRRPCRSSDAWLCVEDELLEASEGDGRLFDNLDASSACCRQDVPVTIISAEADRSGGAQEHVSDVSDQVRHRRSAHRRISSLPPPSFDHYSVVSKLDWSSWHSMRGVLVPTRSTLHIVRRYASTAIKPEVEVEHEAEAEAESSSAAQRRLQASSPLQTGQQDGVTKSKGKRPRGPKALSLLRAQKFAQALQESEPASTVNIPFPTSSTSTSTGPTAPPPGELVPTVEDLLSKQPPRDPPPLDSRRYAKRYQRLYDEIDNAFVARQLLKLAPQVGFKVPRGRGKGHAIKGILRIWGWEPPLSPEEIARRAEIAKRPIAREDRDWVMSQAELWLLMRDTAALTPFLEQGVKFSIPPPGDAVLEPDRRVLRANGTDSSLADLDRHIGDKRDSILTHHEDASDVVDQVDDGLLRVISGASHAYLEAANGKVVISGMSRETVDKGLALLHQAAHHVSSRSSTVASILVPKSQYDLSLFPHIPSPDGSVPWQERIRASRPLFRLRGVQPWESKVGTRTIAHREEMLSEGLSLEIGHDGEQVPTSQEGLSSMLGPVEANTTTTMRFGHVVFPDERPEGTLLAPPPSPRWSPAEAATSTSLAVQPVFLPSLPPSVIHFPLEQAVKTVRQKRYRLPDGRMMATTKDITKTEQATEPDATEPGWSKELDKMLEGLDVGAENGSNIKQERRLISSEKTVNVMMPDRPVDFAITRTIRSEANQPGDEMHEEDMTLLSDLELEIAEAELSPPQLDLEFGITSSAGRIVFRSVKATDVTFGSSQSVRYAELETDGELSPALWAELANITRVVAPDSSALRSEIF